MKTLSYKEQIEQAFPKMSEILKPCESEHFALLHFTVNDEDVQKAQLYDRIHGRSEYDDFTAGTYVKLCRKPLTNMTLPIMSDTFMEKSTNYDFIRAAHGNVLIGGLGIGMVLSAVQNLPVVSSVIVVEKEQEIIDLVKPQLPLNRKVSILHADIFTARAGYWDLRKKFDTIYFDIWDSVCRDNWEGMKTLQRKFRKNLRKGGWMSSWRKEDCRYAASH